MESWEKKIEFFNSFEMRKVMVQHSRREIEGELKIWRRARPDCNRRWRLPHRLARSSGSLRRKPAKTRRSGFDTGLRLYDFLPEVSLTHQRHLCERLNHRPLYITCGLGKIFVSFEYESTSSFRTKPRFFLSLTSRVISTQKYYSRIQ